MRTSTNALRAAVGRTLATSGFLARGSGWWRRRGTVQQVVRLVTGDGLCRFEVAVAVDALWMQDHELIREPVQPDAAHARVWHHQIVALPEAWSLDDDTIVPLRARSLAEAARVLAQALDPVDDAASLQAMRWCPPVIRARLLHLAGDRGGSARVLRDALGGPHRGAADLWIWQLREDRRLRRRAVGQAQSATPSP